MPGQVEPSANARQMARACRDIYVALTQEGFSETQALRILGAVLAANAPGGEGK